MRSLYLFGQSDLFWIQCTSVFHNHKNKGGFQQWSVVPLLLLQHNKAVCYNSSPGHMGFLCSQKVHELRVGGCYKFLSSFQPILVSNQFQSKIWTSKGTEHISWQYLGICNLPLSHILWSSCLVSNAMETFLRSLNALFRLYIWRNNIKTSVILMHNKVSWQKHCMYFWTIYR